MAVAISSETEKYEKTLLQKFSPNSSPEWLLFQLNQYQQIRSPKTENSQLLGSRSKEIKLVLSPRKALNLFTSDHQWQNYCNKEFTFWIFVISSNIHTGVGAHCFGANKFSNLPGIRINSLFSFLAVANPSNTVSIHCCKHKWAVIIQVHIPFFNGFGGGRTTLIDACIREGEVEQSKSSC